MTPISGILLSLVLAVAPGVARQPQTPAPATTARRLFDAGGLAYERGRYADAARAFEAAHGLLPGPAIAFSWAQALRRQYFVDREPQRLQQAIALYRLYLEQTPEGGRREDAVEQLQVLEPLWLRRVDAEGNPPPPPPVAPPTELMIYTQTPGATVVVDGGAGIAAPALIEAEPGTHTIRVDAPGFESASMSAIAIAERIVPVEVELRPKPATLSLSSTRAARVLLDGREVGQTPLPRPIVLEAGVHELVVSAPGRVRGTRTLTLARGDVVQLNVHLPRTRRREAALGLLGTSAALWIGGGVTLGFALRNQERARAIEALRGDRNISSGERSRQAADLTRRDRLRGATIGLWSAAAVAGVISIVLILADRR